MGRMATIYLQVTWPSQFSHQNRLRMGMLISKLPLIFIVAPWKLFSARQNHWCFLNVLWYENWPKIGDKTANINVKKLQFIQMLTATLWVTNRKRQKSKKVILLNNTLTFGDVLLGNFTFFDFCCFRCVIHDVAVNILYKLQFFYIYMLQCWYN